MSIPTQREIEFLVSLQWRWRPLYCRELARLLAQSALRSPARGAHRVLAGVARLTPVHRPGCFDSGQATVVESPQRRRN